jgi:hypothetical protein
MRRFVVIAALSAALPAVAQDAPPAGLEQVDPELSVSPSPGAATSPEEEVTIRRRGTETIEEYAIQGRVYKILVRPQVGPAYFIVDNDGDGLFETRQDDLHTNPPVPQWVLMRF